MPFGPAGAHWLFLDDTGVHFRRTGLDRDRAAATLRLSGFPNIDDWVRRFIYRPPAEEEMLEVFAKVELR
jgi:hypothetical protein